MPQLLSPLRQRSAGRTRARAPAPEAVPAPAEPLAPPRKHPDKPEIDQRPDRLRAAHATCLARSRRRWPPVRRALATTRRLPGWQDFERRGEVQRDGKRWSTEAPPGDIAAAMDRLQART